MSFNSWDRAFCPCALSTLRLSAEAGKASWLLRLVFFLLLAHVTDREAVRVYVPSCLLSNMGNLAELSHRSADLICLDRGSELGLLGWYWLSVTAERKVLKEAVQGEPVRLNCWDCEFVL